MVFFCLKTKGSPQSGHGVYTTPIDFYLIKKRFISVE